MEILNDEIRLRELAERHTALREEEWALKTIYGNEFINQAEPMDDDRFWKGIEILKKEIEKAFEYQNGSNKYGDVFDAIKRGAMAFARRSSNQGKFIDFISFVRTYGIKSGEVYQPCFDNITGCGDDGYSDFCDRLPLIGREVHELAVSGKLSGDADRWTFKDQEELYIESSLEEAVEKLLPSFINERLEELANGAQDQQEEEEDSIKSW